MSASRLNHQNKRRLWKEHGTQFPLQYLHEVNQLYLKHTRLVDEEKEKDESEKQRREGEEASCSSSTPLVSVVEALNAFCTAGNTYAEITAFKRLSSTLSRAAAHHHQQHSKDEHLKEDLAHIAALAIQVLFFDNTKPLHNQMLSCVTKLPEYCISACKRALLDKIKPYSSIEEVALCNQDEEGGDQESRGEGQGERVDPLSRCRELMKISNGLMTLCKWECFESVMEEACVYLVKVLSMAFQVVCSYSRQGNVVSPMDGEMCQNCANVVHKLVSRYASKLKKESSEATSDKTQSAVVAMVRGCLAGIRTEMLPRDVVVTASVTLWTYMFSGCEDNPQIPALWTARALFSTTPKPKELLERKAQHPKVDFHLRKEEEGQCPGDTPQIESPLHECLKTASKHATLEEELSSLSEFGLTASLRGLLAALPSLSYLSNRGQPSAGSISLMLFSSKYKDLSLGRHRLARGNESNLFFDKRNSVRFASLFIFVMHGTLLM